MSENSPFYSIQRTYIINLVSKLENLILTCDQRIDIPTIEPLPSVQPIFYGGKSITVIPCIELAGKFLSEFNLTFETNEGVTVLPVKIGSVQQNPENPYLTPRYVLLLPRGATGVKSCKIIHKATGKEVQHNFTFGIMPPPYNYDNAVFGYLPYFSVYNREYIGSVKAKVDGLKIVTRALNESVVTHKLVKNSGKKTINIEKGMLYYWANFTYPFSTPPTSHSPKITVSDGTNTMNCTLSLDKDTTVIIDLLAGTITAYVISTGEIVQQRKIFNTIVGYKTIVFEDFDDIVDNTLTVCVTGRGVE